MKLMPWRSKKKTESREVSAPTPRGSTNLEKFFDRFFRDPWSVDPFFDSWSPAIDVTETEKEIVVRSEIPGVDPEDLSITISGDILTLSGEKSERAEKKSENYYHTERRFGKFHRSIQLPATVDPDKVTAAYRNGVLTITLNRKAGVAAKRIPVSLKK